jgi:non-ribosomal peptide synthetase component F
MFVHQIPVNSVIGVEGVVSESVDIDPGTSKFDLTFSLAERRKRVVGFIEYSTDLFRHDTIERMAGHYQRLLEAIVADPDQPIANVPILTEAERHKILDEWNDTAADYREDTCIHQLFEEQVERMPEAIAVEFEKQQITYGELNRRANQLAHYLIDIGIGPEKLVGICVERSIEMVVGLLGILKAGGAYIPLDPAYPEERLRFMLEDAQVSVLLTTAEIMEHRRRKMEASDSQSSIATGRSLQSKRTITLANRSTLKTWRTSSTLPARPESQKGFRSSTDQWPIACIHSPTGSDLVSMTCSWP